jgi:hypothetical protein
MFTELGKRQANVNRNRERASELIGRQNGKIKRPMGLDHWNNWRIHLSSKNTHADVCRRKTNNAPGRWCPT